ncbi:MAG TPA: hypothetical protein VLF16_16570 [Pseudomonas sp.]|nr:hypothetical protein [Pseudomonas sp.]
MRTLTLLALSLSLAAQAHALELAKYPQVFDAGNGVSVKLAPSADGKQALVQVSGINHPLDEVVFLTEVNERGDDERDYATTLDGGAYNLLLKRQNWGGDSYQLYLPGTEGFQLGFDEQASQQAKPAELLALYEQQKGEGVQDKLARFDRQKHEKANRENLQALDQEASKDCGTPLQTDVDWNGIDDGQMKRLSISGYCGEVVSQMASLCRNEPAFKAEAAGIEGVECRFDTAMKLRERDGKILFATEENAPNQGDFINAFLRNR